MMGPGWYCDGCGDHRMHDGKESYSEEKRRLRQENERLWAFVRRCAEGDHPDEIPEEAAAMLQPGGAQEEK
jgi:hypothetical protein